MPSAQDLILGSLQMLGVYDPGTSLTAADASTGLTVLNDLMDDWSNQNLACYATLEQNFPLVVGQWQYTIGPGGQINQARPLKLTGGPGAAYLLDSNGFKYYVDVVERQQWNIRTAAGSTINSQLPNVLFYDSQYPLGIMNVFPTPLLAYSMYFDSMLGLTDFAQLTSAMSLPPGYARAIKANLAVELAPYYVDVDDKVLGKVMRTAALSLGNIKRTNIKLRPSRYDAEIVAKGSSSWNIYTDSYNGQVR